MKNIRKKKICILTKSFHGVGNIFYLNKKFKSVIDTQINYSKIMNSPLKLTYTQKIIKHRNFDPFYTLLKMN